MPMRVLTLCFALLLGLTTQVSAQESPEALIEAVYAPYMSDEIPDYPRELWSVSLNALYDADAARTPEGEMGALDFDPFVDGQDFQITDLMIGEPVLDGPSAVVPVTFKNFGEAREMTYYLVREDYGWRVDDVESTSSQNPYRLSEILADPMLN